MLETIAILSAAIYALHFAIYEKLQPKTGNSLVNHWRCGFCFAFWPALTIGTIEHGIYGPIIGLAVSTGTMLLGQLSDALHEYVEGMRAGNGEG